MKNRKLQLEGELKIIQNRMKDIYNTLNGDFNLSEDEALELMWEHRVLSSDVDELIHEILSL